MKLPGMLMYIFSFVCIIPAYIGFKNYRSLSADMKGLTFYSFISVLFEIPSNYYFYHKMNNLFILHVYTVVEFAFLAYVYSFHISRVINKKILLSVTVVFVVGSILNSMLVQPVEIFNTYARSLEILVVISFTWCYTYVLIINNEQRSLTSLPMFWVSIAVFIYFTGGFFLYLVSNNMIVVSRQVGKNAWTFHGFLLAGYYLTIAKAIWIQAKR